MKAGALVWDLPTRLFHWLLVIAVVGSYLSGEYFPDPDLHLHKLFGYAVLWLLLFRLLWGLAGSSSARFASFVKAPGAVLAYLKGKGEAHAGHNPLGALSVIALLSALLIQSVSGLFNSDEILAEGPLIGLLNDSGRDLAGLAHSWGEKAIKMLVLLHLAAMIFYALVKKRRLVPPMVTGQDKQLPADLSIQPVSSWRALLLALLSAAVIWIVTQELAAWLGATGGAMDFS